MRQARRGLMLKLATLALLLTMLTSACGSSVNVSARAECLAFRPLVLSDEEIAATPLSVKRQILNHNETWERLC